MGTGDDETRETREGSNRNGTGSGKSRGEILNLANFVISEAKLLIREADLSAEGRKYSTRVRVANDLGQLNQPTKAATMFKHEGHVEAVRESAARCTGKIIHIFKNADAF